jgi:hypothetical protein
MMNEALETLRSFFLCKGSQLGVTRSYFAFIHQEYPDLHKPERLEVRWETYMRDGSKEGEKPYEDRQYRWQPKFGKARPGGTPTGAAIKPS